MLIYYLENFDQFSPQLYFLMQDASAANHLGQTTGTYKI